LLLLSDSTTPYIISLAQAFCLILTISQSKPKFELMSIIPSRLTHLLQFYLSGPMPCPYLPGRIERKLFTHLTGSAETDTEINATLTRGGFRRSHDVVYRPACEDCNACIPVRIPIRSFLPSRSLRRVAAINRDLLTDITHDSVTEENYSLFRRYQTIRHPDGDMAGMSSTDFAAMLQEGQSSTKIIQLRLPSGKLVGCMMTDYFKDSLSAVYSFYDPDLNQRSLGTQLILALIDEAARKDLAHVYLGYWIAAAHKMAYKARFRPLQALTPYGWDWVKP
jgi:leucyl-tRNA---protein transferase